MWLPEMEVHNMSLPAHAYKNRLEKVPAEELRAGSIVLLEGYMVDRADSAGKTT